MTTLCANCGSDTDVQRVSPDMDIAPVLLCALCRMLLLVGDFDAFRERERGGEDT